MDLSVVPTIGFVQLYVFWSLSGWLGGKLVWINVTAHPETEKGARRGCLPCIFGKCREILTKCSSRPVQRIGRIVSHALVGGLHHQYARIGTHRPPAPVPP
jgi:hypothetical protein